MRFDDRTIELDQETQLYYREYNGKKYYCTDGTITIPLAEKARMALAT